MKKSLLALALMLSAAAVSAQTLATMPNKGGTELRLTIADCPLTKLSKVDTRMLAYSRLQSGKVLSGCWDEFDGQIRVVYEDDDTRLYPFDAFTLTKLGQQVIEAGKKAQKDRKPKLGEML